MSIKEYSYTKNEVEADDAFIVLEKGETGRAIIKF